jgi:hypothetical protein
MERRDGVINVVVDEIHRLDRPDVPMGEVRHIEPRVAWSSQQDRESHNRDAEDLRAVAPAAHSFGRRGR